MGNKVQHRTHVYRLETYGYFVYNQGEYSDNLHSAHTHTHTQTHTHSHSAFIYFVRFSEQRVEFPYLALTNDFYNRAGVCLLRGSN